MVNRLNAIKRILIAACFWLLTVGVVSTASAQSLPPVQPFPSAPFGEPATQPTPTAGGIGAGLTPPQVQSTTPAPAAPTTPSTPEPTGDNTVVLEQADNAEETQGNLWVATGHVRVKYKTFTANCDRIEVNTDAGTAIFTGHLVLKSEDGETVTGGQNGSLSIDMNANSFVIADASTTIQPSQIGIGMIEPLIIYGGVVSVKSNFIDARGSNFTTCDFSLPHFHFTAQSIYVVPGRHLVAKYVSLYHKNKKVLTLPYLVIPLNRRAETLNPQFGEDPVEGYYAKFAIGYLLTDRLPGILHVDLMSKEGVGLGFDQYYGNSRNPKDGSGEVTAYEQPDPSAGGQTLSTSWNHSQTFGNVATTMNTQAENDSYELGGTSSRSVNSQISATQDVGNLDSMFSMNMNNSNYGVGDSDQLTATIDEIFSPTPRERVQTDFSFTDLSDSFTGSPSTTEEQLNSSVEYDEQDKHDDWKLMANDSTDIASTSEFGSALFGGVEKLPEFDLSSDPLRDELLKHILPKTGHFDFSIGDYDEPTSQTKTDRLSTNLDIGQNTVKLDSWQNLDYAGTYDQRFYGDDAAEYILTDHDDYKMKIGKRSSFIFRYDYVRPYGYSPFEFDFSGLTNIVSTNYAYQESRALQLALSSGYDINQARQNSTLFGEAQPWQVLAAQALYTPSKAFGWQQSTSWDPNHGQFIDVTDNFSLRGPFDDRLDIGTRYDPQAHRFDTLTGSLDVKLWWQKTEDAGWKLEAVGGYDGFTDQWDYSGIAVTRSWHDYETSIIFQNNPIGFQTGEAVTFNIRLKAFPAYEPFATGPLGQSLDTGLGTVY